MPITPDPSKWVSKYADYLYSFALARLDDQYLAKDLVQETFLAALERLDQFKGESSERTWLTAILKHKVIDVYRKRSSGPQSIQSLNASNEPDFFESEDGHWKEAYAPQPFVQKELSSVLQQCLKKLPALWFSIFSMKHIDEAETKTICQELRITPSNFWVIIHRAKLNLRACIQKMGI